MRWLARCRVARYWYASPTIGRVPDLQGKGGGPFLDGALNDGFLKAPNRDKMKFALMWANQDWVDVHPAKLSWHQTYRTSPDEPLSGAGVQVAELQMFDGFMSAEVYRNAFKYIAETYFTQPNYYKAPTKLANGSTADCCFFSFYQPQVITAGSNGSEPAAEALMDAFRSEVRKTNASFCDAVQYQKSSFHQDRLGTSIAKALQNNRDFCRRRPWASACTSTTCPTPSHPGKKTRLFAMPFYVH